jgi:penicillin-binding protein 2
VFDYLLLGLVPSVEDMALTQQGKSGQPTGKQRLAEDWPLPGFAVAPMLAVPPVTVARGPR